jgi:hypothetical protein
MPLSSTSTRAEVLAAYADNAGYDVNNSVSQCKDFIVACRLLLSPQYQLKRVNHGGASRGSGGEEAEVDQQLILAQLAEAKAWLAVADPAGAGADPGGGGVVYLEKTSDFRD